MVASQNFVDNFRLGDDNLTFCCMGSRDDYFGSVGWQNILILSFRVGTSKNNTDHQVNETCAIISIQVTYETDHISLLHDSTMSNALNFCFFMYFIVI